MSSSEKPKTNVLTWEPPAKILSSQAHEQTYQSDSGIPGTYVPNMTREDQERWKAKKIKKGDDPRVEVRKRVGDALVLWVVRKDGSIKMSANGALTFSNYTEWLQMETAIAEALYVARHG